MTLKIFNQLVIFLQLTIIWDACICSNLGFKLTTLKQSGLPKMRKMDGPWSLFDLLNRPVFANDDRSLLIQNFHLQKNVHFHKKTRPVSTFQIYLAFDSFNNDFQLINNSHIIWIVFDNQVQKILDLSNFFKYDDNSRWPGRLRSKIVSDIFLGHLAAWFHFYKSFRLGLFRFMISRAPGPGSLRDGNHPRESFRT